MRKKISLLIIPLCYIATILIAIFAILTYLKRRDGMLFASQIFLTLVALINSIKATIKYRKQEK
ncbi:hypothetical protein B0P06_005676 [Clostridium saccharoperbutylacetonicum]|uniref:Uncharacterized protein n=1 Tax=Clostridium saccharoperbutylacetonicum N1-4(HMT) TaxID=931276 RepID=M1LST1_9CLOT|nr:hypothetical protein [Clostridium saccharoperbutylacetonicum]AGF56065.1 hypothetical protein Cspa_c23000 [Clostridium saccharoperbutylacetonicum N1-4(HMT)]NRT63195.1 hypothetical protein [Clostridium saccharoperbutylacetonicum]NSB26555.1 hypothetical protein [Clostridium saccharoperbutylacetonicum]NSB45905.1 hypothetical protein [Clostridium saccharoperbutylacetonicum]